MMGLDMYLTAKRYLSSYREDEQKIADAIGLLPIGNKGMKVKEISCEAMYWRKANAIHRWFVENCQSGVDDCKEYHVSFGELKQLRDACAKIMIDNKKAPDVLPTCNGFFFGSTEFDEWFWDDIKRTEFELSAILENPENNSWAYYYRSSW
jgi:hypothetical protein